jgi:hypothetical protein
MTHKNLQTKTPAPLGKREEKKGKKKTLTTQK